jgi:hypothetical protein
MADEPALKTVWHRDYDACISCGKIDSPYEAKGLCKRCYDRQGQARRHAGGLRAWQTRRANAANGEVADDATLVNVSTLPASAPRSVAWSNEDVLAVQIGLAVVLIALTKWQANRFAAAELEMSQSEATGIAAPTARITLRHLKIKPAMRGDVADAVGLVSALTAYVLRVLDARGQKLEAIRSAVNNA